jgi:hypothetical protein
VALSVARRSKHESVVKTAISGEAAEEMALGARSVMAKMKDIEEMSKAKINRQWRNVQLKAKTVCQ